MAGVLQNIDPTPLAARRVCTLCLWCGGWTHSLGGEGGGGVNILEDARHRSVLYTRKYFVGEVYSAMLWHGLVAVLIWDLIAKCTFKAFSMLIVKFSVVDL
jgi:hypothetical protein